MSKKLERPINWQIVNLKVTPEELMDAPVLLITGSKALNFSPEEVAKIRSYIQMGGMIFSTADGASQEFTESVKKLASKVVEENGRPKYEMAELGKDHVLFSQKNELWAPIARPPRILSMSNGVREIWVHSTVDMGGSWQGRKLANADHFDFPANLYRYASGKASLRSKLSGLTIATGSVKPKQSLTLGRIDYAGNWDPEPGAWPRMSKLMLRDTQTDMTLKTVKFGELDPKTVPVAHMTGTTGFSASETDVAAVKKYLEDGGTIVADAAGGSPAFTVAFDKLMQQVTGKPIPLAAIPQTSKIYNGSIAGSTAMTKADYRWSYRLKMGTRTTAQLKGVEMGGRFAVIYSEEDLTSGLLGTQTWGILGYTPESSQSLVRNVLLYGKDPKAGKDGTTEDVTASTSPATQAAKK